MIKVANCNKGNLACHTSMQRKEQEGLCRKQHIRFLWKQPPLKSYNKWSRTTQRVDKHQKTRKMMENPANKKTYINIYVYIYIYRNSQTLRILSHISRRCHHCHLAEAYRWGFAWDTAPWPTECLRVQHVISPTFGPQESTYAQCVNLEIESNGGGRCMQCMDAVDCFAQLKVEVTLKLPRLCWHAGCCATNYRAIEVFLRAILNSSLGPCNKKLFFKNQPAICAFFSSLPEATLFTYHVFSSCCAHPLDKWCHTRWQGVRNVTWPCWRFLVSILTNVSPWLAQLTSMAFFRTWQFFGA